MNHKSLIWHILSSKTNKLRVAVIGDIMEDIYQYGNVSRVSPEFPVQILHSPKKKSISCPGGAANVAYQFTHLNCDVSLFGFVDHDMNELLKKYNFDLQCIPMNNGKNPRKTRFYDGDFPLLRWDIEESGYGEDSLMLKRMELFEKFITGSFDVVIMSNYGKGVFDEELAQSIINECNKRMIPTIVDPKANPLWWRGCRVFKPNAKEASSFCDNTSWIDQPIALQKKYNYKSVIVTHAGEGISGISSYPFEYRPKNKIHDVSSVIGAGDCFAAVLAFCIGHGLTVENASEAAFEAGSQYVMAKHNKPLTFNEIHKRFDPAGSKLVNINEFLYLKENDVEKKIIFTNGCFDIMHVGHLDTLNFAKSLGDLLVVAINSDESISKLKGNNRPILPLKERMELLSNIQCVDFVIPFNEDDPYNLISAIQPNVVVKGEDYRNKKTTPDDYRGEIVYSPIRDRVSTTNIIHVIMEKYGKYH